MKDTGNTGMQTIVLRNKANQIAVRVIILRADYRRRDSNRIPPLTMIELDDRTDNALCDSTILPLVNAAVVMRSISSVCPSCSCSNS